MNDNQVILINRIPEFLSKQCLTGHGTGVMKAKCTILWAKAPDIKFALAVIMIISRALEAPSRHRKQTTWENAEGIRLFGIYGGSRLWNEVRGDESMYSVK